jgi:hypothetical protein
VHIQEPLRPGESHNAESQSNQDATAHHGQEERSISGSCSEDDSEVAKSKKRRKKSEKRRKGRTEYVYVVQNLPLLLANIIWG